MASGGNGDTIGRNSNNKTDQQQREDAATANSSWSENEIELVKIGLRSHGATNQWAKICESLPDKSADQCKAFFYANRTKLQLDKIVKEYKKVHHD